MTKLIRGAAIAVIIGAIALLAGGLDPYFAGYDPSPNEKNFEMLFSLPMLAAIAVSLLILKFTKETPDTVQPVSAPAPVPVQQATAPMPAPAPVQPAPEQRPFMRSHEAALIMRRDDKILHVECDGMHGQIELPIAARLYLNEEILTAFAWLALAPYMQKTLCKLFNTDESCSPETMRALMELANYALTHDGRTSDYDMPR